MMTEQNMVQNTESREIEILQAAEENDPKLVKGMTPEERKRFDNYVGMFNMLRERNGGTLAGLDIDIPYNY